MLITAGLTGILAVTIPNMARPTSLCWLVVELRANWLRVSQPQLNNKLSRIYLTTRLSMRISLPTCRKPSYAPLLAPRIYYYLITHILIFLDGPAPNTMPCLIGLVRTTADLFKSKTTKTRL